MRNAKNTEGGDTVPFGSPLSLEGLLDIWQKGSGEGILADMAQFGDGKALNYCPHLQRLMGASAKDGDGDMAPITDLIASLVAGLRAQPLAFAPLRHQSAAGGALLQIAQSGGAALSLILNERTGARDGDGLVNSTVCFEHGEIYERVLGGQGTAKIVNRNDAGAGMVAPSIEEVALRKGALTYLNAAHQAKRVVDVQRTLLTLRLSRVARAGGPAVEMRVSDGMIVHRASARAEESRREMAMAVLSAMGRRDAIAPLDDILRNTACTPAHRWEALRHCLALDTQAGFLHLMRLARDDDDPLSQQAEKLQVALIAQHPELRVFAEKESVLCPAC